jgi:sugar phosphate isomerase/epimerase
VDTYWLQYAGVDILATLDKLKGRIGCTHLKDYAIEYVETEDKKEFKPIFAPVGNGNIDFAPVIAKMRENGAKYYFVEQDNASKLPDPLFEVEQSVRYIKNNL